MKKKVKKRIGILLIVTLVLILIGVLYFIFFREEKVLGCGDGTLEGVCSLRKPYFCSEGILIEKASECGCSDILTIEENSCVSEYQTEPRNITFNYVLRGEEGEINFTVYGGMIDYIEGLSDSLYDFDNGDSSRQSFKSKKINDMEQRELILGLVTEIQNIAESKEDQMRIAVSLVQEIPYGESNKSVRVGFEQIYHSRYAYEVLYENLGACEGRSELLALMLKEIGYGIVLFYYPLEDHEVVGIKCPEEYSLDGTGYCFVETTGPSIISNNQEYYLGLGKLSSEYETVFVSEGDSLGEDLYEYKDAEDFIELNKIVEETGELNIFRHYKLKALKEKYAIR